jgi:hypothetical protein
MAARDHSVRNGPARALLEAPPDTPVRELPQILADVPRYECRACGNQRFARSAQCGQCGSDEIEKVPGPGVDG